MARKKKRKAAGQSAASDAAELRAGILRAWKNPIPGDPVGWCEFEVNNVRQCEHGIAKGYCEGSLRGKWSASPC
jgi:hypothetical protein